MSIAEFEAGEIGTQRAFLHPVAAIPAGRVLRLSETIDGPPQSWLWDGYLPDGYCVTVDGLTGSGKSLVVFDWIARVTTGADWPDKQLGTDPSTVLLVTHDLHVDTVKARLQAAGSDLQRVLLMDEMMHFPHDLWKLRAAADEYNPRLIVIDPLGYYTSGAGERQAAKQLAGLAKEFGACVIFIRHTVKSATSAATAGAGSHVISGVSRAGFLIGPNPRDRGNGDMIIAGTKNNLAPIPPSKAFRVDGLRVSWLDRQTDVGADELIPCGDRSAVGEAKALLIETLNGGPCPVKELQTCCYDAGMSRSTVNKAKRELGILSRRLGGLGPDGAWWWFLPADPSEPGQPA